MNTILPQLDYAIVEFVKRAAIVGSISLVIIVLLALAFVMLANAEIENELKDEGFYGDEDPADWPVNPPTTSQPTTNHVSKPADYANLGSE